MEYLEEYGEYSPGLFIADSPVTQLSESEFKDNTMKLGLLKYLLSIYKNDEGELNASTPALQIIIIEQKERLPMLDSVTKGEPHVKVIEFTGVKNKGRYGFLIVYLIMNRRALHHRLFYAKFNQPRSETQGGKLCEDKL